MGHVVYMGKGEGPYRVFWWRNLRKTDHLENVGMDGRII
jgi:hypothetical protein